MILITNYWTPNLVGLETTVGRKCCGGVAENRVRGIEITIS
jgi:hypothetical protein